jgi:hypothetical protein
MAVKIPHRVTIDGKTYTALLPDVYGDIKGTVGIEICPSPDNTDYAGKVNVSQSIARGELVRITCGLENKKTATVLCVTDKFVSAMGGLLTKKIGGIDVKTTRIPRRMRLG